MTEKPRRAINLPLAAALVAIAAAAGFGAAQWTGTKKAPVVAAVASSTPAAAVEPVQEVNIPGEYLKAAGIAVEAVAAGGLRSEILAPGSVAAQPNSEAVIVARAAGNIARINRQLGDTVKAGETLATVESMEAAGLAAERTVANAKAELARKNQAREASLFEQGVTPRADLEAAQATLAVAESEAQRANAVARAAKVAADGRSVAVVSPIAGKVTFNAATLGSFVQPQTELFRVAGTGPVQIEAAVSSADIIRISSGDQATVIASNGMPVDATVRSVTSTVNGATRSATVILTPTAATAALVVGEGVRVRLHVKGQGDGLMVPEEAVQNLEGRDVVFVRSQKGFRIQPVLVGIRSGGVAQIVSGVKAGDQVATRNAFLVKADMIKSGKEE